MHQLVRTQFRIGRYRADFAFPDCKLIIETDGHDFHKTKEQRTYDAERDRFLSLEGWRVLRFTRRMVTSGEALTVTEQALQAGVA